VPLTEFLSKASDVSAFAKNAGPQALRIDYLAEGQRLAFYTPDFFVRIGAECFLVEMKGQVDRYRRQCVCFCEGLRQAPR